MTYPYETRKAFFARLGDSWIYLADVFSVPAVDQRRWRRGDESMELWNWLVARDLLSKLSDALVVIDRSDLATLLESATRRSPALSDDAAAMTPDLDSPLHPHDAGAESLSASPRESGQGIDDLITVASPADLDSAKIASLTRSSDALGNPSGRSSQPPARERWQTSFKIVVGLVMLMGGGGVVSAVMPVVAQRVDNYFDPDGRAYAPGPATSTTLRPTLATSAGSRLPEPSSGVTAPQPSAPTAPTSTPAVSLQPNPSTEYRITRPADGFLKSGRQLQIDCRGKRSGRATYVGVQRQTTPPSKNWFFTKVTYISEDECTANVTLGALDSEPGTFSIVLLTISDEGSHNIQMQEEKSTYQNTGLPWPGGAEIMHPIAVKRL